MPFNIGVVSVICFYFISGYLMKKSYARFMTYSHRPAFDFYIDRAIKLFPQYAIVVCISFASIGCFGKSAEVVFMNQDITIGKVLLNFSLLPANYVFPPLAFDALNPHPVIPPAWSLATEFHFYLMLPFIFWLKRKSWLLLLSVTLGIQFSSFFFADGAFNSDNFGYRYIFGVLTVFLYGFAFAGKSDSFFHWISLLLWMMFTVFLFFIAPAFGAWNHPFVPEVLLGGFIALPLGYYFTKTKTPSGYQQIDNLLGDLAYPMFISHFLSFYLVEKLFAIPVSNKYGFYSVSIVLCILLSYCLSLFQKKVEAYRIKRRGFSSLKATVP
jgi:peptidoglycan/LPS O-acetylase OafA/YrhL